jgi:apolipoprotein N-acyltransferase
LIVKKLLKGVFAMKPHIRKETGKSVRLSYLWLVLAFVLSLFAMNGAWDFPLAAWLSPLFLLRFTRTSRPFTGFLAASLVNAGAACILSFQIGLGLQIPILVALVAVAIFMSLPYLIDRFISPRLSGIMST